MQINSIEALGRMLSVYSYFPKAFLIRKWINTVYTQWKHFVNPWRDFLLTS